MLFKSSLTRLATHLPRQPSIKFPSRTSPHAHLTPSPHPHAPQSIIDAFPSFLQRLASTTQANSIPLAGPAGGAQKSEDGFSLKGTGSKADWEGEWAMPAHLSRGRYRPTSEEIEAVESGGATSAPLVTKSSRAAWYTPAKL